MKHFLWVFISLIGLSAAAQKLKKADKLILSNLQSHINYLANDQLEGRRTGTAGEKLAYEYIMAEFQKAGFAPKGEDGGYIQHFDVYDGKAVAEGSAFIINNVPLQLNTDYFPFSFSPNFTAETSASISLKENGSPWFFDLKELIESNSNNPHFDLVDGIKEQAASFAKKGATALLIFNSSSKDDELKFEEKSRVAKSVIPIFYLKSNAREKFLKDETANIDLRIHLTIEEKHRTGHNVIGYIDNGANNTVIIGAHYDHLGYGEDHNSLYAGTVPMIHNGADDNASGTAALIEMGKLLKAGKLNHNNYLLVAFSGEELGLFGSKYFTDHPTIDLSAANYMINMDMVGRLNDSTHGLSVGGYGTSPIWGSTLVEKDPYFTIKFDSSGTGPSDHTSFYRKDLPVLFFFTGIHSDYHKPSDDADKINFTGELMVMKYIYHLIEATDSKGKLSFTKTREAATGSKSSFKVTLGIMPDYTFSGNGVRADGVSDGKPAQKAGLKGGDIILQLGDYKCPDLQAYMEALSKFKKGDSTKVKVMRGKDELYFDIIF